jgi:hypothetical protein
MDTNCIYMFDLGLGVLAFDASNVLFGSIYGMFCDGDDVLVNELVMEENDLGKLVYAFVETFLSVNWIARHF